MMTCSKRLIALLVLSLSKDLAAGLAEGGSSYGYRVTGFESTTRNAQLATRDWFEEQALILPIAADRNDNRGAALAEFALLEEFVQKPDGAAGLKKRSRRAFLTMAGLGLFQRDRVEAGYRNNLYEAYTQAFEFARFDPAALQSDMTAQLALQIMGRYAIGLKPLYNAWREGRSNQTSLKVLSQMRSGTIQGLLEVTGLRQDLERLQGYPLAEDPSVLWDRLVYSLLPRYFASKGILFSYRFTQVVERNESALQYMELGENFGLYPVRDTHYVDVPSWEGKPERRQEIMIPGPFALNGEPMATVPFGQMATALYGRVVHYLPEVDRASKAFVSEYGGQKAALAAIQGRDWEDNLQAPPARRVDPLLFSEARLIAEEIQRGLRVEEIHAWELLTNRIHENDHIRHYRRGDYPKGRTPAQWPAYFNFAVRTNAIHELDAFMAELRWNPRETRRRVLLTILSTLRSPTAARVSRLAAYNLLDLLLTYLEANAAQYRPQIRLLPSDLSPRAQISGQLYRLTPEQIARAMDAVHAMRLKDPWRFLMPQKIDKQDLYVRPAPEKKADRTPRRPAGGSDELLLWAGSLHAAGHGDPDRREKEAVPPPASAAQLVEQSIQDLAGGAVQKMIEAMKFLAFLQIDVADKIRRLLDHSDGRLRRFAAAALGQLGDAASFEPIARRLAEEPPQDVGEFGLLAEALVEIDYRRGMRRLLDLYTGAAASYGTPCLFVLREQMRPEALPVIKEWIERNEPDDPLVLPVLGLLGETRVAGSQALLLEIFARAGSSETQAMLIIALAQTGDAPAQRRVVHDLPGLRGTARYLGIPVAEEYARKNPELRPAIIARLRQIVEDPEDPDNQPQAAAALARLKDPAIVDYWSRAIQADPATLALIGAPLASLRDPRILAALEKLVHGASRPTVLLKHIVVRLAAQFRGPEAMRILEEFAASDPEVEVRRSALRGLFRIRAEEAGIPQREVREPGDAAQGLAWVPAQVYPEDGARREELDELVRQGVLKTWKQGAAENPVWAAWRERSGLDEATLYFAPVRDPSMMLVEQGEPYPAFTGRALVFPSGPTSYTVKYSGAAVPYVRGRLAIPYYHAPGLWLYGGLLRSDPNFGRETANGLRLQEIVQPLLERDPIGRAAREQFGVEADLFLRPMLRVTPLCMPAALLDGHSAEDLQALGPVQFRDAKRPLAYVPWSEGMRLAGVPAADREGMSLQIYQNRTGKDARLQTHGGSPEAWRAYIQSFVPGAALSEIYFGMSARFAVFLRAVHDYLRMSADPVTGDIFTVQNTNPRVVFDYATFASGFATPAQMRRQIMGALTRITQLGESVEFPLETIRQARRIFGALLTGRWEVAGSGPLGRPPAMVPGTPATKRFVKAWQAWQNFRFDNSTDRKREKSFRESKRLMNRAYHIATTIVPEEEMHYFTDVIDDVLDRLASSGVDAVRILQEMRRRRDGKRGDGKIAFSAAHPKVFRYRSHLKKWGWDDRSSDERTLLEDAYDAWVDGALLALEETIALAGTTLSPEAMRTILTDKILELHGQYNRDALDKADRPLAMMGGSGDDAHGLTLTQATPRSGELRNGRIFPSGASQRRLLVERMMQRLRPERFSGPGVLWLNRIRAAA